MKNAGFFLAGFGLLFVQANLFRLLDLVGRPELIPSLVLPLILFMGVHEYSLTRGAASSRSSSGRRRISSESRRSGCTRSPTSRSSSSRGPRAFAWRPRRARCRWSWRSPSRSCTSVMILVLIAIFGRDAYVPRALYPLAIPQAHPRDRRGDRAAHSSSAPPRPKSGCKRGLTLATGRRGRRGRA